MSAGTGARKLVFIGEDLSFLRWVGGGLASIYLITLQNAPQGWSREQGHCLAFFFFLSLSPLFASRTQLPHLTFSIWPLPRGETAGVRKGGRHTSGILLSFNLLAPFHLADAHGSGMKILLNYGDF